jgi:NAD(P)-dependent dehydrogenase (short-subunit alcohol dehydrogenase family)
MARVFITGSADGLGRLAAETLVDDKHEVVVQLVAQDRAIGEGSNEAHHSIALTGGANDCCGDRGPH